jgi:hypothetical protein
MSWFVSEGSGPLARSKTLRYARNILLIVIVGNLPLTRWPVAPLAQPVESEPFTDHYCKFQFFPCVSPKERLWLMRKLILQKNDHYSRSKPIPHVIFHFFLFLSVPYIKDLVVGRWYCAIGDSAQLPETEPFADRYCKCHFLSISLPGSLIWRAISQQQLPCYPYPIPLGCSQIDNLRS